MRRQSKAGDLDIGMQFIATVNVRELIDKIALEGKEKAATALGLQIIESLQKDGSLLEAIDPQQFTSDVLQEILYRMESARNKPTDD